jgi:hypothetical protein
MESRKTTGKLLLICKRRSKNPSLEATEWFGSSPE